MATPGTNIQFRNTEKNTLLAKELLGFLPNMKRAATSKVSLDTAMPRVIAIGIKDGVPATNTAADAPTGIGDLCVNTAVTPKTLYRCSAYTSPTVFTWTQVA